MCSIRVMLLTLFALLVFSAVPAIAHRGRCHTHPVTPAPSTPAPSTMAPSTPSPTPTPKAPCITPPPDVEVFGEAETNNSAKVVDGGLTDVEQQLMLTLINKIRAQYNRSPLIIDPNLMETAQAHANDQAKNCEMSHTGSNGSNPGDRATTLGYSSKMIWENVAAGQQTVESAMDSWITSPGHFDNLVNCPATQVGFAKATNAACGNYNVYWAQVFGLP